MSRLGFSGTTPPQLICPTIARALFFGSGQGCRAIESFREAQTPYQEPCEESNDIDRRPCRWHGVSRNVPQLSIMLGLLRLVIVRPRVALPLETSARVEPVIGTAAWSTAQADLVGYGGSGSTCGLLLCNLSRSNRMSL